MCISVDTQESQIDKDILVNYTSIDTITDFFEHAKNRNVTIRFFKHAHYQNVTVEFSLSLGVITLYKMHPFFKQNGDSAKTSWSCISPLLKCKAFTRAEKSLGSVRSHRP